MTVRTPSARRASPADISACIFDVDGVLLASPHERAWREALVGFADAHRFTSAMYQAEVAGRPRLDGARAALTALGVPDARERALAYADGKQRRLETIVASEGVAAFPDALDLIRALLAHHWPLAAASSSKNAEAMMRGVALDESRTLLDVFDSKVCGRDLPRGKPDPAIFLLAAAELGVEPARCVVIEDAPAGIEAARKGGMGSLGVARLNDAAGLRAAGADRVVTTLDDVGVDDLVFLVSHRTAA